MHDESSPQKGWCTFERICGAMAPQARINTKNLTNTHTHTHTQGLPTPFVNHGVPDSFPPTVHHKDTVGSTFDVFSQKELHTFADKYLDSNRHNYILQPMLSKIFILIAICCVPPQEKITTDKRLLLLFCLVLGVRTSTDISILHCIVAWSWVHGFAHEKFSTNMVVVHNYNVAVVYLFELFSHT